MMLYEPQKKEGKDNKKGGSSPLSSSRVEPRPGGGMKTPTVTTPTPGRERKRERGDDGGEVAAHRRAGRSRLPWHHGRGREGGSESETQREREFKQEWGSVRGSTNRGRRRLSRPGGGQATPATASSSSSDDLETGLEMGWIMVLFQVDWARVGPVRAVRAGSRGWEFWSTSGRA